MLSVRNIARFVLGVSLGVVCFATLVPTGTETFGFSRCLYCGSRATADVIANVVLFAPVGAALLLSGVTGLAAILTGAAVSLSVELAQMAVPGRDPGISDLLSNTAGTTIGVFLAARGAWVLPPPRLRKWLVVMASALTTGVLAASGYLFAPSVPDRPYWGQWTPHFASMEKYTGQLHRAEIGAEPAPPDALERASAIARELQGQSPVKLQFTAGRQPRRVSPIFSIADDRGRRVLVVGAIATDLVYRHRMRAADWRFDQPDIRVADALAQVREGAVTDLTIRHDSRDYCVAIGAAPRCGLGFGPGGGWALLTSPTAFPVSERRILDALWLALLGAPIGFWLGRDFWSAVAVIQFAGALAFIPQQAGMLPARSTEWIGAALGLIAGRILAVAIARVWHWLQPTSRSD